MCIIFNILRKCLSERQSRRFLFCIHPQHLNSAGLKIGPKRLSPVGWCFCETQSHLQVIEDGTFDHNIKLKILDLVGNELVYIPADLGPLKHSLEVLRIQNAMAIKLNNLNFSTLTSLSDLVMGANPLTDFDASNLPRHILHAAMPNVQLNAVPEFSTYTPFIQSIGLSKIQKFRLFSDESVKGLENLVTIKFYGGNFKTVPDLFNRPLKTFMIYDNPIHCNVSLCWIRMWNWKKPRQPKAVERTVCGSPGSFHGKKLMEIDPVELSFYKGECPLTNYLTWINLLQSVDRRRIILLQRSNQSVFNCN